MRPIHDRAGALLAYRGRAANDESPSLIFPNGFDPHGAIFSARRIVEGELFFLRDPLHRLAAHENGVENVVAFLTENVTAQQLEQLPTLMEERKCENREMFLARVSGLILYVLRLNLGNGGRRTFAPE